MFNLMKSICKHVIIWSLQRIKRTLIFLQLPPDERFPHFSPVPSSERPHGYLIILISAGQTIQLIAEQMNQRILFSACQISKPICQSEGCFYQCLLLLPLDFNVRVRPVKNYVAVIQVQTSSVNFEVPKHGNVEGQIQTDK